MENSFVRDANEYLYHLPYNDRIRKDGLLRIEIRGLFYHIHDNYGMAGEHEGFVKPEPTNVHDPNAMKICVKGGKKVGYVPREECIMLKEAIGDRMTKCTVRIFDIVSHGDHVSMEGYILIKDYNADVVKTYEKKIREQERSMPRVPRAVPIAKTAPALPEKKKGWFQRLCDWLFSGETSSNSSWWNGTSSTSWNNNAKSSHTWTDDNWNRAVERNSRLGSDGFDHETFEKQIGSDEYFDFRW